MTASFSFSISGNPLPKARPRVMRISGRTWAYTPARTKAWEQMIAWTARQAMQEAGIDAPLAGRLRLSFRFGREGRRRCDLDNLIKAGKDALNGVLWNDDEQIDRLTAVRVYGCKIGYMEVIVTGYELANES